MYLLQSVRGRFTYSLLLLSQLILKQVFVEINTCVCVLITRILRLIHAQFNGVSKINNDTLSNIYIYKYYIGICYYDNII